MRRLRRAGELLAIVDKAIERLSRLEDENAEVTDFVEKLQSETVSTAETKRAEQVERHFGDCNRLMTRNIDAFHRLRRNEDRRVGDYPAGARTEARGSTP